MGPIALVLFVVASASAQGDYFIDYGGGMKDYPFSFVLSNILIKIRRFPWPNVRRLLECLIREVDSFGSDIKDGYSKNISSVTDCQELCKNNDECKYFLYGETGIHSGSCWLKDAIAESLIPLEGTVFGPKTCERTTGIFKIIFILQ